MSVKRNRDHGQGEVLRQRAEARLAERRLIPDTAMPDLDENAQRYVHELHVHQVELEMQNEELIRMQKDLESSRQRLFHMFHKSPVGYLILDDRGIIRDANATFHRLTGLGPEAIMSRAFSRLLAEPDQSPFLARYKAVYKNPEGKWMEHRIVTAEGELLPVRLEASFLAVNEQDGDDPSQGLFLMAVIDLTAHERIQELQRLEEERRTAMDLLEQRTHALGERVKELQCIYRISAAFQQDLALPELLQEAVRAIPAGWQYPEITCARIFFDGWEFVTEGYRETPWTMTREIFFRGRELGSITVGYLEQRPQADDGPFLREEWDMLHALAGHLGRAIERKAAEDELRRTTQMLDMFYSTSLDLLLILTPEGRVVRVNREWEQTLGYGLAELEGQNIADYIHPDDLSSTIEARQKICEGEIIRSLVNRYRTRHGDYRIIEWRSVAAEGLVFAVGRDITERKRIEEHLFRQSELQRLLMHSAIALINRPLEEMDAAIDDLLRVMGRFARADRVCLFKYELEQGVLSMTHEWAAQEKDHLMPAAQKLSAAVFAPWTVRHRKGEAIHIPRVQDMPEEHASLRRTLQERGVLSLLNTPMNHGDECLGFVCFQALRRERTWTELDALLLRIASELLTNVRLRRRNELAMLRAHHELEDTARARQIFLAKTSHELRTPLNGILGMNDLLRDTPLTGEQQQFVENIHAGARHLLTLINDILDLTKIEVGKMDLDKKVFDLRKVMAEAMDLLAPNAQEKGLELVCLVDADVPGTVVGDPGRLRQIVTNLTGNAVKFTQEGEVVTSVSVERSDGQTIGELDGLSSLLRFTIRDTGIGIPADRMDMLFAMFSQTDRSIAGRFGGTGLGLAISRELVHLMGGDIGVSSQEGQGATFWFTVRLGGADQVVPGPEPDFSGVNVLVVDENAANRQCMRSMMQPLGVTCQEAATSDQALDLLARAAQGQAPVGVVFVNWKVEAMDAAKFGRVILDKPELGSPRLIVLLPLTRLHEAGYFRQAGFTGCLAKPVRRDRLRQCLAGVTAGHKDHEPLSPTGPDAFCQTGPGPEISDELQQARILVAEDDPVSRQVMLGVLKRMGFAADAVSDGWEAIRALENNCYDLVFMDCVMQGLDGIETTRRIRAAEDSRTVGQSDGRTGNASPSVNRESLKREPSNREPGTVNPPRRIPIIALTGHALPDDRGQFLEAGMDDHLPKPVFPATLRDMLNKWLT